MTPFRPLSLVAFVVTACSRPPQETAASSSLSDSVQRVLAAAAAMAPVDVANDDYTESNLPRWAYAALRDGGYLQQYGLFLQLNPFFQSAMFDEDSLIDVAVQITQRATGKRGIAIVHRSDSSVRILGAGTSFANGGDDFSWVGQWFTDERDVLRDSTVVGRQVLYVGKGDSAGGMIWWNGTAYVWTQWGD